MDTKPSNTHTLQILGKDYGVTFPVNRQFIAIQNLRAKLAANYAEFQFMGEEAMFAGSLVDSIAHLSILAPQFIKELNKDMLDLSLSEGLEIVKVYNEDFRKWYDENLQFIFKVNKEEDVTTTTEHLN